MLPPLQMLVLPLALQAFGAAAVVEEEGSMAVAASELQAATQQTAPALRPGQALALVPLSAPYPQQIPWVKIEVGRVDVRATMIQVSTVCSGRAARIVFAFGKQRRRVYSMLYLSYYNIFW